MKKTLSLFFLLMSLLTAAKFHQTEKKDNYKRPVLSRIAFGSCNRQEREQPLWPFIVQNKPQLWIWLGDNIYGDTEDMAVMKQKYDLQKNNKGYQQLLATCPAVGIWDDHDYGVNDGGKEFIKKAESQELMLNFLDEPTGSLRRKREGAYTSYLYGKKDRQIKVILLDGRYFRDELKKEDKGNVPNETGDILGEAQWDWLEKELTDSPAAIHLIGCGIQIIPEEHPFEKWANFPQARRRLFDLLQKAQPKGVMLLSGDRHIAEVSKIQLPGYPTPIFEITSSGLTHTYTGGGTEPNQYRVGQIVNQLNFGFIEINWNEKPLKADVQIKGLNNTPLLSVPVTFGEAAVGE
jgi:alkaline phosphatase D